MVVVYLLRAAWIAGILPIMVASIPSSKIAVLHKLLLRLSGRGKIMDPSSKVSNILDWVLIGGWTSNFAIHSNKLTVLVLD